MAKAATAPRQKYTDDEKFQLFEDLKQVLWKYSVEWVSEQSGVTAGTIYNWINEITIKPRIDTVVKVAEALGYEVRLVRVPGAMKNKKPRLRLVGK